MDKLLHTKFLIKQILQNQKFQTVWKKFGDQNLKKTNVVNTKFWKQILKRKIQQQQNYYNPKYIKKQTHVTSRSTEHACRLQPACRCYLRCAAKVSVRGSLDKLDKDGSIGNCTEHAVWAVTRKISFAGPCGPSCSRRPIFNSAKFIYVIFLQKIFWSRP